MAGRGTTYCPALCGDSLQKSLEYNITVKFHHITTSHISFKQTEGDQQLTDQRHSIHQITTVPHDLREGMASSIISLSPKTVTIAMMTDISV